MDPISSEQRPLEKDSVYLEQRERIRLAAVQLFTRQGFAGTSMKELAQSSKMAPGNLYNYYRTKEAILFDVLEHQLLRTIERNREILGAAESPERTLYELAHDLVVRDLSDPVAAFVGIQGVKGLTESNLERISSLMAEIRKYWLGVISAGAESGAFDVRDEKLSALSVLTLCSSVSTWFRAGGDYSAEYVAEGIAATVLRMVGCRNR